MFQKIVYWSHAHFSHNSTLFPTGKTPVSEGRFTQHCGLNHLAEKTMASVEVRFVENERENSGISNKFM